MEERNGSLVLSDDEGRTIKRHVSQTKQVFEWRHQTAEENNSRQEHEGSNCAQRAPRTRRAPGYLQDFIRGVDDS